MYEFHIDKYIDTKIGRLTIVGINYDKSKANKPYVYCKCDCGNKTTLTRELYGMSDASSCGKCNRFELIGKTINDFNVIGEDCDNSKNMIVMCNTCKSTSSVSLYRIAHNDRIKCKFCSKLKTKHNGLSYSRVYSIRRGMVDRCYNKNNNKYSEYGGRGILVCDEWLNKDNGFINFYNWAMENGYSEDLSIDRIDVNWNYEPDNCRWADIYTQANNTTRNIFVEINGELKTIAQIAREHNLNYDLVWKRYKLGMVEGDLIKPIKQKRKHTKILVNIDGVLSEFKTQTLAGEFLGVTDSSINQYLSGKLKCPSGVKIYRMENEHE